MIEIVTQPRPSVTCAPIGDLDPSVAILLRHAIARLAEPGFNLGIDLGDTGHVGAIGISALVGVTRLVHSRGGSATVTNPDADVRRFLQRLVGVHCLSDDCDHPGPARTAPADRGTLPRNRG